MGDMSSQMRKVLHEPKLDTVLMVEQSILNAEEYPTKTQLWRSLPRKIQYQTFQRILEYLEASGKITFNSKKILWIGVNDPKLKAMIESCKKVS